jgi:hypothetical protein
MRVGGVEVRAVWVCDHVGPKVHLAGRLAGTPPSTEAGARQLGAHAAAGGGGFDHCCGCGMLVLCVVL